MAHHWYIVATCVAFRTAAGPFWSRSGDRESLSFHSNRLIVIVIVFRLHFCSVCLAVSTTTTWTLLVFVVYTPLPFRLQRWLPRRLASPTNRLRLPLANRCRPSKTSWHLAWR